MISRRKALRAGAGLAALATVGAPSILHAQTKTLKITTWGGKWGEIMNQLMLFNDQGKVDSSDVREVFHIETKAGQSQAGQ